MLTTLAGFTGAVITPDSPEYETAARTPLLTSRPALVVRPAHADDVGRALTAAAAAGLPVVVRGGGHSFAGRGTSEGGMVIDLRSLDSVEMLDGDRVVVGGGATWGAVATVLSARGLAISSGDTASVGVGGLTLSGGIGWMVRAHGLALDQVRSMQVVTASGDLITADREHHADLFWALRGGGGGFGVVTSFELAARPMTSIGFGTLSFPASEARRVLAGWAAHLREAPRSLSSTLRVANPFAGGVDAPVEITVAAFGDDTDELVAPLRGLGTLQSDTVREQPYVDILEEGGTLPPGLRLAVRSGFVNASAADAAVAEIAAIASAPQPTAIVLHGLGGAVADVDPHDTAYAHRQAELLVTTFAGGPAAAFEPILAGIDGVWNRLAPHVDGAYANFLDATSSEAWARAYPEATLRRLDAIKASVDPGEVFARAWR